MPGMFCSGARKAFCDSPVVDYWSTYGALTCFCATYDAVESTYKAYVDAGNWSNGVKHYRWDHADPCLIYYDDLKMICARCKFGAIRIITYDQKVFCGTQKLELNHNKDNIVAS